MLVPPGTPPLTSDNAHDHVENLYLVEVKATRKAIKNVALNGFFFGTTARQYELAKAAAGRYRYAFVVLSSANDYGRPFYVLLTLEEVEARTQSKRLQYQVSFKRDTPLPPDVAPSVIPLELLRQAKAGESPGAP